MTSSSGSVTSVVVVCMKPVARGLEHDFVFLTIQQIGPSQDVFYARFSRKTITFSVNIVTETLQNYTFCHRSFKLFRKGQSFHLVQICIYISVII